MGHIVIIDLSRTLGDEVQRSILKVLSQGPMSVTKATHALDVSPPNISSSLSRLTEARVLAKAADPHRVFAA